MSLKERFRQFHEDNPKAYELFEKFTKDIIRAGRKHFGAQAVFERIRWHVAIETTGDEFKINNSYVAFYTRMFEDQNPEHRGFFRTRRSKADSQDLFI